MKIMNSMRYFRFLLISVTKIISFQRPKKENCGEEKKSIPQLNKSNGEAREDIEEERERTDKKLTRH